MYLPTRPVVSSVLGDLPASPHPFVEFFALDRFHAISHMRNITGESVPAETAMGVVAALNGLVHAGPVHVLIAPGVSCYGRAVDGAADGAPLVTDRFEVRPFEFIQV